MVLDDVYYCQRKIEKRSCTRMIKGYCLPEENIIMVYINLQVWRGNATSIYSQYLCGLCKILIPYLQVKGCMADFETYFSNVICTILCMPSSTSNGSIHPW